MAQMIAELYEPTQDERDDAARVNMRGFETEYPRRLAAAIRVYHHAEITEGMTPPPVSVAHHAARLVDSFTLAPVDKEETWIGAFCNWANGLAKAVERGNVPEVGEVAPFGPLERLIGLDVVTHRWGYVAVYAVTCDATGTIRFRSPWFDQNPTEDDRNLAEDEPAAYLDYLANATDFDAWPDSGADYCKARQLADYAHPAYTVVTAPGMYGQTTYTSTDGQRWAIVTPSGYPIWYRVRCGVAPDAPTAAGGVSRGDDGAKERAHEIARAYVSRPPIAYPYI